MLKTYAIGSDIDGTMIENTGDTSFLFWLEKNGCPNAHTIFQTTHDWMKAAGLPPETLASRYTQFLHSPGYCPPSPLPGAPEAFAALSKQCNIHLITARSRPTRKVTLLHLRQHFNCPFTTATFSALGRKSHYVEDRRVLAFFEDNPAQALEVAAVAPVILIPSPADSSRASHRNLIRPLAHRRVTATMTVKDWQRVWRETWQEIPHLVHDLKSRIRYSVGSRHRPPSIRSKKIRTA